MLFHLFNIDQSSDSEVYLYGKEENKDTGITTIRVVNIISPIYFLPTAGKDDLFLKDLKNFTNEIKSISKVKRTNIFNNLHNRDLHIFKIEFKRLVNFSSFDSEYCEMQQSEFLNPVENIIISKRIMGPGILKLDNMERNRVDFNDISFVKNTKFTNLKIGSIAIESCNQQISKFVYYSENKNTFYRAILKSNTLESNDNLRNANINNANIHNSNINNDNLRNDNIHNDNIHNANIYNANIHNANINNDNLLNDFTVFRLPKDLNNYLNEIIRKDSADIILVHNFHLKSKLNIRDKIFCDIFQFASGTIKGRDYSIQEIANLYKINKEDNMDGDALALLSIFKAMNALELAKEMAEISGYILNKCLLNSRAERIEYNLLHELYSRDYMFPSSKPKIDVKYAGGLVLEPVQGFYEDIILLLDFNSLYPSIIQEFNVCFSTIGSSNFYLTKDNSECILNDPDILSSINEHQEELFLPKILRNLVKRRKTVKEMIKNCKTPEEKITLDIRQKALKLTANSIYGCLGFTGSRFCNFEMAAFITAKGRELLAETKLIAESLNMKVIYGDTDSIMIHTKYPGSLEYYNQVLQSASVLVEKINSKYTNIEIELEKTFKKLLLYTKKRYAALVFNRNNSYIETKGIDLVRRDFCTASSDLSKAVLNILLEDKEYNELVKNAGEIDYSNFKFDSKLICNNNPETVERIYKECTEFYNTLFKRPIDDFIITSVLSKDISLYNRASNLPHVSLALRLKETKGVTYLQDDVVPYVIGEGAGQISTRSYHPNESFQIDYDFYIKHQILPPLFRLIALIPYVHQEKIGLIFNIKGYQTKVVSKTLTFITPCCEHVQECSKTCNKCGLEIPDNFYIEKVNKILVDSLNKLYKAQATCIECEVSYSNHLIKFFYCGKDLKFYNKNSEFNSVLESLEISFKNIKIPLVNDLILRYLNASNYRTIDFSLFFDEEIKRYKANQ